MTGGNPVLRQALAYARRGWPVFPCQPGQKIPATAHGLRDASTDEQQITRWFTRHPDRNLAIATGAPGPDVLDVDQRGRAGHGFAAFRQLRQAGLLDDAASCLRTPGGGLHVYFAGSAQRNGHLPRHHLDFLASGGAVLAPPSRVGGSHYQLIGHPGGQAGLDWAQVRQLLEPEQAASRPERYPPVPELRHDAGWDIDYLAGWVARLSEGNRNAGLFWAANRALDTDLAADLTPLAIAARQAGLDDPEIRATLSSARRTTQPRPFRHDRQAEEVS
jgi:hypothetical protein